MSPWARIDDKFHSHPKRFLVPLAADGLFVRALSYAADQLTDGFVPEPWVRQQVPGTRREWDQLGLVAALVKAEMWSPVGGGYQINDYLEFNPSRAEVERKRQAAADRMRRNRTGSSRDVRANTERTSQQVRSTPCPVPSHTQPIKTTLPATDAEVEAGKLARVIEILGTGNFKGSPDEQGVLATIGSMPSVDHVAAAYEAVLWVKDPKFNERTAHVVFRYACRKFLEDAAKREQGPQPEAPAVVEHRCLDCDVSITEFQARNRSRRCDPCLERWEAKVEAA